MSEINLLDYIRPYDPIKDAGLPEYSHSRLEVFETCPYQFDLKYNQNKISSETTIALELGSLLHLCLEHKGKMLINNKSINYDFLEKLLMDGGISDDGRGNEFHIAGLSELKKKYFEIWKIKDSEGRDYSDKVENFLEVLYSEMGENDGWEAWKFEEPFKYVWNNKYVFHGFIDRIDRRKTNNGYEYRLVDYKTSKKVYDSTKTATSQQFSIYQGAILLEYGVLATECLYRFICINDSQLALTKGWEKRFITKMNKVFEQIEEGYKTNIWKTSTGPLCFWCIYNELNPDARLYKNECPYHSNWTPTNKDFSVNKEWNPELTDRKAKAFDW